MSTEIKTEIVVIGAGPGGYSAAFRAADLGKKVLLIERHSNLGGVCLNVGCIPSKTLLHAAKSINNSRELASHGIKFTDFAVDIKKLQFWKNSIIKRLTSGLRTLAHKRNIEIIHGEAKFISTNKIEVNCEQTLKTIIFEKAIIAAGSDPINLPFLPKDPRIINSTGALELENIPKKMLIIGGGVIGLEMATIYSALGTQISIVESTKQLIPGADTDLVKPLHRFVRNKYKAIMLETKAAEIEPKKDGLLVKFEGKNAPQPQIYNTILVSVGRRPNGEKIGCQAAGIKFNNNGFIPVDDKFRTNISNIYAVGDIIGMPMLAHKAVYEGRLAAEIISGMDKCRKPKAIPTVAYTDPEISWVGITEKEAQAQNLKYGKGVFPWLASGRSLSLGRDEGITQLLFDKQTGKLLGAGVTGPDAGELISSLSLAIEIGCTAKQIAETIQPHPTLSETIMMAAEAFEGTITDLYIAKNKDH